MSWLGILLLRNEQTGHALSRSNTHRRNQDLLLLPSAFAQTSHNLSRTSASQRMSQRNSPTSWVHLLPVQLQRIFAVHSHTSERLVQLEEIDVVDRETVLAQQLGHGDGWANTHDARRETGDGGANELGNDGLAELERFAALHEEDGGGAVGDLRGVSAGGAVAVVWESWANLVEGFEGCAPAWALVFCKSYVFAIELDGDGCDLVVEPPTKRRMEGQHMS